MTSLKVISISALVLIILVSGCATTSPAGDSDAAEIISLINSGNADELTALSSESFLLDAEILHGSSLTGNFWNGLASSGFSLVNAEVVESRPPAAADKALFGEGAEVDAFFSRYIQPQAVLFRIGSDTGSIILILGPSKHGNSSILAFGGPY